MNAETGFNSFLSIDNFRQVSKPKQHAMVMFKMSPSSVLFPIHETRPSDCSTKINPLHFNAEEQIQRTMVPEAGIFIQNDSASELSSMTDEIIEIPVQTAQELYRSWKSRDHNMDTNIPEQGFEQCSSQLETNLENDFIEALAEINTSTCTSLCASVSSDYDTLAISCASPGVRIENTNEFDWHLETMDVFGNKNIVSKGEVSLNLIGQSQMQDNADIARRVLEVEFLQSLEREKSLGVATSIRPYLARNLLKNSNSKCMRMNVLERDLVKNLPSQCDSIRPEEALSMDSPKTIALEEHPLNEAEMLLRTKIWTGEVRNDKEQIISYLPSLQVSSHIPSQRERIDSNVQLENARTSTRCSPHAVEVELKQTQTLKTFSLLSERKSQLLAKTYQCNYLKVKHQLRSEKQQQQQGDWNTDNTLTEVTEIKSSHKEKLRFPHPHGEMTAYEQCEQVPRAVDHLRLTDDLPVSSFLSYKKGPSLLHRPQFTMSPCFVQKELREVNTPHLLECFATKNAGTLDNSHRDGDCGSSLNLSSSTDMTDQKFTEDVFSLSLGDTAQFEIETRNSDIDTGFTFEFLSDESNAHSIDVSSLQSQFRTNKSPVSVSAEMLSITKSISETPFESGFISEGDNRISIDLVSSNVSQPKRDDKSFQESSFVADGHPVDSSTSDPSQMELGCKPIRGSHLYVIPEHQLQDGFSLASLTSDYVPSASDNIIACAYPRDGEKSDSWMNSQLNLLNPSCPNKDEQLYDAVEEVGS